MRALLVREFGPVSTHRVEEVPDPQCGDDDVLIDVRAIGLNFPDLLMLQGKYQTRPQVPFVPGRDAAGEVLAVGANVSRFKPGDRVMAQVPVGAFAEKLAAPQVRCYAMTAGMSFEAASAMITPYNTAYVAVVVRGAVREGEQVLVTGAAGSVGLAMVQLARARGARVIAAVSSAEKAAFVREHGADATVDTAAPNLVDRLRDEVLKHTEGRGVDVVLETVGGELFDAAIRCLGFAGRMVIVGFASLAIPAIKGNRILLKNIAVIGAPLDIHFKEQPDVMARGVQELGELFDQGKVRPIVAASYPLERFTDAANAILGRSLMGRVVLTI